MKNTTWLLIIWTVFLFGVHLPVSGDIYYVDKNTGSDSYDGSSSAPGGLLAGPKATIQAGIDIAGSGDTIIVADGTYTGLGNRDIYLPEAFSVTVRSANGPGGCIINCQGSSTQPHRGFYLQDNTEADMFIDGFTITGGYTDYGGGAIACLSGSVTIRNCIISANSAVGAFGGGLYIYDSDVDMVNCVVEGNYCNSSGGGIYCTGSDAEVVLTNCTIYGNVSEVWGGGIKAHNSVLELYNSIVWANEAVGEYGLYDQLALTSQGLYGAMIVSYCDIQGGYDETLASVESPATLQWDNNIESDPDFLTPGYWDSNGTAAIYSDDAWYQGDYHLALDSPVRNIGSNSAVSGITNDIQGSDRISNGTVDMGPYETVVTDGPDLEVALGTVSLYDTMVPGDKGKIPVVVTNSGNEDASGKIDINIYFSTDQTIDSGDDLIAQMSNQNVKLKPGKSKTYNGKVVIPADMAQGEFYLLVWIDSGDVITETDESAGSNVVVDSTLRSLLWQFGDFDGRKGVKLTVADTNGASVTFTVKGGWGLVTGGSDFSEVALYQTTTASSFAIAARGGSGFTSVGDIVADGSLKSISAKTTNLRGDITIGGTVAAVTMRNVDESVEGGHSITISGQPSDSKTALSLTFASVADLSITAPYLPIKAIKAYQWINTDEVPDTIRTPFLTKLDIKGDKKTSLAGDCDVDLILNGDNAPKSIALGSAKIAGAVNNADWIVDGHVGAVTVGALNNTVILIGCPDDLTSLAGTADDFNAEYSIKGLTIKGIDSLSFTSSQLAAWEIQSLKFPTGATASGAMEYHILSRVSNEPAGIIWQQVDAP